ncbi:MAG: sortase [Actinomycetota bacterium]
MTASPLRTVAAPTIHRASSQEPRPDDRELDVQEPADDQHLDGQHPNDDQIDVLLDELIPNGGTVEPQRPQPDGPLPAMATRAVTGLGRVLMVVGLLILAFAAFQLWGTGVTEARAQDELTQRFRDELDAARTPPIRPVLPIADDPGRTVARASGASAPRAVSRFAPLSSVAGARAHTDPDLFDPTVSLPTAPDMDPDREPGMDSGMAPGTDPDVDPPADAALVGSDAAAPEERAPEDGSPADLPTLVVELPTAPAGTGAATPPVDAESTGVDDRLADLGVDAPPPDRLPQPAPRPRPAIGEPVGILAIPAIGLTKTIAEGTSRDVLRSGPGHYPSTPLPHQGGNVAIAGHRTTHGAPFLDIDRLQPGDEITLETVDGTFVYAVEGQVADDGTTAGHRIVTPDQVAVIADRGDDRLTLTACHPKYSARERIIVTAVLVAGPPPPAAEPAPAPETPAVEPAALGAAALSPQPQQAAPEVAVLVGESTDPPNPNGPSTDRAAESLGWQSGYAGPVLAWAAAAALVAAGGATLGRRWRRLPAYAMATPLFGFTLFGCFVNLERLLPAI